MSPVTVLSSSATILKNDSTRSTGMARWVNARAEGEGAAVAGQSAAKPGRADRRNGHDDVYDGRLVEGGPVVVDTPQIGQPRRQFPGRQMVAPMLPEKNFFSERGGKAPSSGKR